MASWLGGDSIGNQLLNRNSAGDSDSGLWNCFFLVGNWTGLEGISTTIFHKQPARCEKARRYLGDAK